MSCLGDINTASSRCSPSLRLTTHTAFSILCIIIRWILVRHLYRAPLKPIVVNIYRYTRTMRSRHFCNFIGLLCEFAWWFVVEYIFQLPPILPKSTSVSWELKHFAIYIIQTIAAKIHTERIQKKKIYISELHIRSLRSNPHSAHPSTSHSRMTIAFTKESDKAKAISQYQCNFRSFVDIEFGCCISAACRRLVCWLLSVYTLRRSVDFFLPHRMLSWYIFLCKSFFMVIAIGTWLR